MRLQTRLLLVMALVAAVFTQLPRAVDPQTRAAFAAPAGGDAVTVWNANAGVAATAACIAPLDDPFHESRIYAMMHIAIHDALNAIDRRSRPYAFDMQAEPGASPDAAVAAAARDVLVPLIGQLPLELVSQSCIDAGVASVEAAYTAALAADPRRSGQGAGYRGGTGRGGGDPRPESRRTARLDHFLISTARRIPTLASTSAHRVPRSSPLRYGKMSPPSF